MPPLTETNQKKIEDHIQRMKELGLLGVHQREDNVRGPLEQFLRYTQLHPYELGADRTFWQTFRFWREANGLNASASTIKKIQGVANRYLRYEEFASHSPKSNIFGRLSEAARTAFGKMKPQAVQQRYQSLIAEEENLINSRSTRELTPEETARLQALPEKIRRTGLTLARLSAQFDTPGSTSSQEQFLRFQAGRERRRIAPSVANTAEAARALSDLVHWGPKEESGFVSYLMRPAGNSQTPRMNLETAQRHAQSAERVLQILAKRYLPEGVTFKNMLAKHLANPDLINQMLLDVRNGRYPEFRVKGGAGISGKVARLHYRQPVTEFVNYLIERGALPYEASLEGKLYHFAEDPVHIPQGMSVEDARKLDRALTDMDEQWQSAADGEPYSIEDAIKYATLRLHRVFGGRGSELTFLQTPTTEQLQARRIPYTEAKTHGESGVGGRRTGEMRITPQIASFLHEYIDRLGLRAGQDPLVPTMASYEAKLDNPSAKLEPFTLNAMSKLLNKTLDEIGITSITAHGVRGDLVTRSAQGGDVTVGQSLARHKNLGTTFQYVKHLDEAGLRSVLTNLLERLYWAKTNGITYGTRAKSDLGTKAAQLDEQVRNAVGETAANLNFEGLPAPAEEMIPPTMRKAKGRGGVGLDERDRNFIESLLYPFTHSVAQRLSNRSLSLADRANAEAGQQATAARIAAAVQQEVTTGDLASLQRLLGKAIAAAVKAKKGMALRESVDVKPRRSGK